MAQRNKATAKNTQMIYPGYGDLRWKKAKFSRYNTASQRGQLKPARRLCRTATTLEVPDPAGISFPPQERHYRSLTPFNLGDPQRLHRCQSLAATETPVRTQFPQVALHHPAGTRLPERR